MSETARGRLLMVAAIAALAALLYLTLESDFGPEAAIDEASVAAGEEVASDAERRGDASVRAADGGVASSFSAALVRPIELTAPVVRRDDPDAGQGTLSGRVVSMAGGGPVEGAQLTFAHDGTTRTIASDADGRFTLAPQEPGSYVLALIEREGFLPFAPEWGHSPIRFHARPGVRIDGVLLTLTDAVDYTVRVFSEEGEPVAGASVRVLGAEDAGLAASPLASSYVTDDHGVVVVHAPDGSVLEARHDEEGAGRAHLGPGASASHALRIDLARAPPASLSGALAIGGHVVGPQQTPVEDARVTAVHLTPPGAEPGRLHPPLAATTDAEGSFALLGADPGSYAVRVRAAGYAQAELRPVAAGSTDSQLVLEPDAAVLVRAVDDETGEAVHAMTVLVDRRRGELQSERLAVESAYDDQGELEVRGLPEGPCRVRVSAPGYAISTLEETVARAEPEAMEVRLRRGGRLVGRVVSSPDRSPLAGARVSLEGGFDNDSGPVMVVLSSLTDADGRFELAGVAPGTHSVVAWASGHHGRIRSGVVVGASADFEAELGAIDLTPLEEGEEARIELAGIGAVLAAEGDVMLIRQLVEGGGAAEVGLTPGDAILEVEDRPVGALGFTTTIERIRGPEGTYVRLKIRHEDGREEVISIPRRRIRA